MVKDYLNSQSGVRRFADGGPMGGSPMPGGDAAMSGAAGGMPPMEGGGDPMAPGAGGAPAPDPNDPMAEVDRMVGEWVQSRDPGLESAICEALASALGYTDGGGQQAPPAPGGDPMAAGGAGAPAAAGGMPAPAGGGGAPPMFRRGGQAPAAKPAAKAKKGEAPVLPQRKAAAPAAGGFKRRK